jgi:hypothetical protein
VESLRARHSNTGQVRGEPRAQLLKEGPRRIAGLPQASENGVGKTRGRLAVLLQHHWSDADWVRSVRWRGRRLWERILRRFKWPIFHRRGILAQLHFGRGRYGNYGNIVASAESGFGRNDGHDSVGDCSSATSRIDGLWKGGDIVLGKAFLSRPCVFNTDNCPTVGDACSYLLRINSPRHGSNQRKCAAAVVGFGKQERKFPFAVSRNSVFIHAGRERPVDVFGYHAGEFSKEVFFFALQNQVRRRCS